MLPAMAGSEAFGAMCRRVCQEHGWELLPGGIRVALGGGRFQLVEVELFESRGRELVRLATTVGNARELGEERLSRTLRWNADLVLGAFAVRDGDLVMTDTMLLRDIDEGELDAAVGYLAETADHYERLLFQGDIY
jgi:hypothetical protein